MDNKQKEQMKKGLVFGGLGLLFALSMWFIFAPSGKDKTAAEQGLNDSIPQATTEKLTENKLKAYELGDKAHEEEQTREEMGKLSDYFAQNTAPSEAQRAETDASTAKIESSMHRYEENNPKSVIRISLCRTAKRNPLIFSIWTRMIVVFLVIWPNIGYACLLFSPSRLALIAIRTELSSEISSCWN